jgi:outer membrane protein insertion porin family
VLARAQEPQVPPPPSQAPIVVAIDVEGEDRWTEQQLRAALGQSVGAPLDLPAINRGLTRLWTVFHVRADVSQLPVEGGEGGVRLRLSVVEVPADREPRFIGNVKIDQDTLEEWALLEDQAEIYEHQAQRIRQRLIEGYHRQGFYFVEVSVVKRGGEGQAEVEGVPFDVIFEIQEGPKVRVSAVEIRGNDSMPDRGFGFWKEGLSAFAKRKLKGPGLFNWRGSPFVMGELEADLLAMRTVYRERGWLDVVVEVEELAFNAERDRVEIRIVVDEGEPYTVGKLGIEAVEWADLDRGTTEPSPRGLVFPLEELLGLCRLRPGERFEETARLRDVVKLREYYGQRGYLAHESLPRAGGLRWEMLPPELVANVEKHTVDVYYRIVQGQRLTIREVRFAGPFHTRDKVLRREVSVFPGQQADLKEINRSLARIQGTGYFSDSFNRLEHREPTYRFLPVPGQPDHVDLEYVVEEGRVVDFNVSGGIDTNEGAFGLITLTMRNFDATDWPSSLSSTFSEIFSKEAFHGGGQRLDLELSPGTEVTRARVHFLDPDIFSRHLEPVSLDLDFVKILRIYDTHEEDRTIKSLKFGQRFGFNTSAHIGYSHTDLEVTDLDEDGVPPLLEEQEQLGETDLAGLTLDVGSSSLDNLLNPTRGYLVGLNSVVYDELFDSDFEMVKNEFHWDVFRPAWKKADGTTPVVHFEIDAGLAWAYDDTDTVPYTERYFLGGSRSLRGFDFRGVGPNDPVSDYPFGGQTYVSGTLELQYPLYSIVQPGTYERIESLRGVVFFDFGVLDPDQFALDLDELRTSVGFGIGLAYPLPMLLNFGFPIREGDGDERQTFSFSLGLR